MYANNPSDSGFFTASLQQSDGGTPEGINLLEMPEYQLFLRLIFLQLRTTGSFTEKLDRLVVFGYSAQTEHQYLENCRERAQRRNEDRPPARRKCGSSGGICDNNKEKKLDTRLAVVTTGELPLNVLNTCDLKHILKQRGISTGGSYVDLLDRLQNDGFPNSGDTVASSILVNIEELRFRSTLKNLEIAELMDRLRARRLPTEGLLKCEMISSLITDGYTVGQEQQFRASASARKRNSEELERHLGPENDPTH